MPIVQRSSRRERRGAAWLLVPLIAIALSATTLATATVADAASEIENEIEPETTAVTLDGMVLLRVRGTQAYPADRRARDIAERIRAFARDASTAPDALRVEDSGLGTNLMVGERRLLSVYDADSRLESMTRQELAEAHRAMIVRGVRAYRESRAPERLVRSGLYALGATVAFVLLLLLLAWVSRKLMTFAARRYREGVKRLPLPFLAALQPAQMLGLARSVLRLARVVAVLVLVYVYLQAVLGILPWTRAFALGMFDLVIDPLAQLGRAFVGAIPNLMFIAALWIVVRVLLRILRLFFDTLGAGRVTLEGFDPDWAQPTYKIIRMLVVAFALVVAFPYIPGSESGAFKGVSIFIGIIFSLGSSSMVANIIAGYTMTYRRAFKIGDRVSIGDAVGDVTAMRLQVTHLRSLKNEEIVIPNSVILNGQVTNYTTLAASQGLILHTSVGIGYEVPWRQVEAMLCLAAGRTPGLLEKPGPFVLQKSLGDFCIVYELNVYCNDPRQMNALYTELHRNILDVFNEYGVQIMTPAYEGDPREPKLVPRERWHEKPAPPPARDGA